MVGVDVKEQARRHNEAVAERLGWSQHLHFVTGTIGEADLSGRRPDVVLALHACDTATDDAIARAVRWQAPVLLAAPAVTTTSSDECGTRVGRRTCSLRSCGSGC